MHLTIRHTIVLGGSFNPPTMAHAMILRHAMDMSGAGKGVFVPSSGFYVARKARRQRSPYLFSEQDRLAMLEAMAMKDARLSIDTCEFGDESTGRTLKTLEELQAKRPYESICFLTGSDKLSQMARWKTAKDLFNRFPIVILSREQNDVEGIINASPLLKKYEYSLVRIPDLPEAAGISSTEAQKMLESGDPAIERIMNPDALKIARRLAATSGSERR